MIRLGSGDALSWNEVSNRPAWDTFHRVRPTEQTTSRKPGGGYDPLGGDTTHGGDWDPVPTGRWTDSPVPWASSSLLQGHLVCSVDDLRRTSSFPHEPLCLPQSGPHVGFTTWLHRGPLTARSLLCSWEPCGLQPVTSPESGKVIAQRLSWGCSLQLPSLRRGGEGLCVLHSPLDGRRESCRVEVGPESLCREVASSRRCSAHGQAVQPPECLGPWVPFAGHSPQHRLGFVPLLPFGTGQDRRQRGS